MSWYPKAWNDDHLLERFIYALVDPRLDNKSIYIGHTSDYKRRYKEHTVLTDPTTFAWLEQLETLNLKPKMIILETDDLYLYEVIQFESLWIKVMQNHGYNLVNSQRDQERGTSIFQNLKELASRRKLPQQYLKEVKESEGRFFFLPDEFIDGISGVYAPGIDLSVKGRKILFDVYEGLMEEYFSKGNSEIAKIIESDLFETKKYYEDRKQEKIKQIQSNINQRVKRNYTS